MANAYRAVGWNRQKKIYDTVIALGVALFLALFVGGSIVLGLYAMIVWRLLVAAANGRERFSQMVAVGIAGLLVFHVFVNVGMTLRLIPVTGLPLPFLSAGGTFFIAMSLGLGLAHSVWMRRSPVPDE